MFFARPAANETREVGGDRSYYGTQIVRCNGNAPGKEKQKRKRPLGRKKGGRGRKPRLQIPDARYFFFSRPSVFRVAKVAETEEQLFASCALRVSSKTETRLGKRVARSRTRLTGLNSDVNYERKSDPARARRRSRRRVDGHGALRGAARCIKYAARLRKIDRMSYRLRKG